MTLVKTKKSGVFTTLQQKIQLLLEAGFERHQQGHLGSANLIYEQIRELDPENVLALQLSGVLAGQVGQHEVAITLLSRAIDLKPDYAEALGNRGIIFKKMERVDEALADYSNAIDLNPQYADAYYNRGIIFQELYQNNYQYYYYWIHLLNYRYSVNHHLISVFYLSLFHNF